MTEIVAEEYTAEVCSECHIKFWIPTAMHEVGLMRPDDFSWWCPNGHEQCYKTPDKKSDAPEGGGEVVSFTVVK